MTISDLESSQIEAAAKILRDGGVVIFPTDTVYGIGCRYDDTKAMGRLYKIKKTSGFQPFPVLVSSLAEVERLAKVTPVAVDLIQKYWPGGLTVVLEAMEDNYKIGFRMPDSEITRLLIDKVGMPIVGTSANFHGEKTPTSFEELNPEFSKLADFVIKGECARKMESTVVDATMDPPKVLRQGAVKL